MSEQALPAPLFPYTMPLLTTEDIQAERNIDLTDPNGQEITTTLIDAAIDWVESEVGFPIEEAERTSYFSDGYEQLWLPTKAPVREVSLHRRLYGSTYQTLLPADVDYDPDTGEVRSLASLPSGMKAVKAEYTSGWTAETLPRDLRKALIDLVTLQLQQVNNFASSPPATSTGNEDGEEDTTDQPTGEIKSYSVDGFSVQYSTAEKDAYWKAKVTQMTRSIGDDVPAPIKEVVARYRLPFAK